MTTDEESRNAVDAAAPKAPPPARKPEPVPPPPAPPAPVPAPGVPELDRALLQSEYEKLKDEQGSRIQFRDNLVMAQLGAVGAVVNFILSSAQEKPLLNYGWLVIPWISSILGWYYFSNDVVISQIRDYVAERGRALGVFGWETRRRSDRLRPLRKFFQTLAELFAFAVPGIAALAALIEPVFRPSVPLGNPVLVKALFFLDVLLTLGVLLGAVVIQSLDARPAKAPPPAP
jgi:hypothetical protein